MIIISAGHHAKARGACANGISEWPVTVVWAKYLANLLEEKGYMVEVIEDMILSKKIQYINKVRPQLALEIHFNSSAAGGKGSETLYCPGSVRSKAAANKMQEWLGQQSLPNRGAKAGWYRMEEESRIPDAFLSQTTCLALIVEPLFIQQKEDVEKRMAICCRAMAQAIMEIL